MVLLPAEPGRRIPASGSPVLSHQQPKGCRPNPLKLGSAPVLSEWQATTVASSRRQVTPCSTLSATRTPGRAPWRASIAAHAHRRAALTALVIRACARPPPAAISSSVRQAVGTEATSPNSSAWSVMTRKSLITSAPSATAHARSASTRPRSWISSRSEARAFDSPAVSPVRSDSARSSATPACDTIPVPSAVTSSPFNQPVVFTQQVLFELDALRTSAIPIVPVQEHFSISARRSAANPR